MKFADLAPQALEKIKGRQWDRIIEKHEGPEAWDSALRHDNLEFIEIAGYPVLLPVDREHHPNITVLRCIQSRDGQSLTVFLKDTTWCDQPENEMFTAGFMAVCDKVPEEDFFLAILYHEWFIVPDLQTA